MFTGQIIGYVGADARQNKNGKGFNSRSCNISLHSVSIPFFKTFFCILYTRQDDTAKNSHIPYHMKVCYIYIKYIFSI